MILNQRKKEIHITSTEISKTFFEKAEKAGNEEEYGMSVDEMKNF